MKRPTLNLYRHPSRATKLLSEFSPETKLRKMKKFLSSPLARRKSFSRKTFGIHLCELVKKDHQHEIPFIVKRLCNYVENHGLKLEGIFEEKCDKRTIEALVHKIDEDGNAHLEEDGNVTYVASLLLIFLRRLPDPVIPNLLSRHFILAHQENKDNFNANLRHLSRLVCLLPDEHFNLLKYLIHFLRKISSEHQFNKMTSKALGSTFGPIIFRVNSEETDVTVVDSIVTLFIENHAKIFDLQGFKALSSPQKIYHNSALNWLHKFSSKKVNPSSTAIGIPDKKTSATNTNINRTLNFDSIITDHLLNEDKKGLAETCQPFRPFSLSEGAEIIYSYDKMSMKDQLKRSRSHSEVVSLNNDVNLFLSQFNDENVFSINNAGAGNNNQAAKSCEGLAPAEILCYDSDEMHEMRRRLERQTDMSRYVPSRPRKHSGSGKKSRSPRKTSGESLSNPTSPTKASGSGKKQSPSSTKENKGKKSASVHLDLSKLHIHAHGSEPIPSAQPIFTGSKYADLPIGGNNDIVLCPRRTSDYRAPHSLEGEAKTVLTSEAKQPTLPANEVGSSSTKQDGTQKNIVKSLKKKFQWLRRKVRSFEKSEKDTDEKTNEIMPKKIEEQIGEVSIVSQELKEVEPCFDPEPSTPSPSIESFNFVTSPRGKVKTAITGIKLTLAQERAQSKRPEAIEKMTPGQLVNEKSSLQKCLLQFERRFGRPGYVYSDDMIRPLYDRYRLIKMKTKKRPIPSCPISEGVELDSIIEDKAMEFEISPPKNFEKMGRFKKKSRSRYKKNGSQDSVISKSSDEKHPEAAPEEFSEGSIKEMCESVISEEEEMACVADVPEIPVSDTPPAVSELGRFEEGHEASPIRVYDQSHLVSGPEKYSDDASATSGHSIHDIRRLSDPTLTERAMLIPASNYHLMTQYELMKQHKLLSRAKNQLMSRYNFAENDMFSIYIRKMRKYDKKRRLGFYFYQYKQLGAKLRLMEALIMKNERLKIIPPSA